MNLIAHRPWCWMKWRVYNADLPGVIAKSYDLELAVNAIRHFPCYL